MEEKSVSVKKKKSLLNKGIFPFLFFILFWLVYFGYFAAFQTQLLANVPQEVLSSMMSLPFWIIFKNTILIWTLWFVLWLLSMIVTYILYILKNFWLRKVYILNPIFFAIAYWIWAVFWRRLVYREPRYSDLWIMIIDLIWKPAFYVWSGVLVFCALRFVLSIVFYFTKKKYSLTTK